MGEAIFRCIVQVIEVSDSSHDFLDCISKRRREKQEKKVSTADPSVDLRSASTNFLSYDSRQNVLPLFAATDQFAQIFAPTPLLELRSASSVFE